MQCIGRGLSYSLSHILCNKLFADSLSDNSSHIFDALRDKAKMYRKQKIYQVSVPYNDVQKGRNTVPQ